jgi:hypothetical protein
VIAYSGRAIRGLAFLFRPFNDIDVFVEDTAITALYEILIKRLLEGRAQVRKVFPLGGRSAVVDACRNDFSRDRRSLYLIDGDADVLVGNPAPELPKLYRLRVYCCENLVLSEGSVVEIAFESMGNVQRDEIRRLLDFGKVAAEWVDLLMPLVVVCVAAHVCGLGMRSLSINASELAAPRLRETLSKEQIDRKIAELISAAATSQHANVFTRVKRAVEESLPEDLRERLKLIPGKAFLVPLVFHLLKSRASYSGTSKSLCIRLARYCDIDIDPGLAAAVRTASKG